MYRNTEPRQVRSREGCSADGIRYVFERLRATLARARVLMVEGVVQRAHGQINVLAERGWKVR